MNIKSTEAIKFLFLISLLSSVLAGCGQPPPPTVQPTNQPAAQQSTTPTPQPAANNSAGNSQTAPQIGKIAFVRDGSIHIADNPSSPAKAVAKGDFPSISPSGKLLAYTRDIDTPSTRIIEVIDLATNKVQNFKNLGHVAQFGPLWSPDEKQLAFNFLVSDGNWGVGVVDLATGEWKVPTKGLADKVDVYLGAWTAQGDSIVVHSLENVYEVSLDGEAINTISMNSIVKPDYVSSETRFSLSPDKKLLLYGEEQEALSPREKTGVFVYDLEQKKSRRITPEGMDPKWLPDGQTIIFTKYKANSKEQVYPDIYITNLAGAEQLFLANGNNVSVAALQ